MMTDLGNIAAGMGQRIDSVAKAVFNATTGEFEMMKQLGIKVKKEGDNITAIFRGVETKMKFNTENILNYLRTIGKEEFAGAIEDRANTLTGAFSNLMDMTDEFQVAIGDAGLTATLTGLAREATGVLTVNTQLAHSTILIILFILLIEFPLLYSLFLLRRIPSKKTIYNLSKLYKIIGLNGLLIIPMMKG